MIIINWEININFMGLFYLMINFSTGNYQYLNYLIEFIKNLQNNKHHMSFLSLVNEFLKPKSVSCIEGQPNAFDQPPMQDEFEAESAPTAPRKVPSFQHLMQPVMMITGNVDFIKGFRFDINFPLSQFFTTSHSWNIPNSGQTQQSAHPMMPPQTNNPVYTFTTQLVRDIKGREPTTVMVGKVDTEGKVDSIFVKKLNEYLSLRLTGQFMSRNLDQGMVMLDLDYEDKDSNAQLKLGPGHWGLSFMQRVHRNVMLGFDYTNVYQQRMSAFSYAAKAYLGSHSIIAQYMALHQQLNIAYMIPIKRGSTFISHYKYDATSQKSTAIVGLKQRYQNSQIVATINSKQKLITSYTLKGPSYGIRLCAQADYEKQDYAFGYGVTVGMME